MDAQKQRQKRLKFMSLRALLPNFRTHSEYQQCDDTRKYKNSFRVPSTAIPTVWRTKIRWLISCTNLFLRIYLSEVSMIFSNDPTTTDEYLHQFSRPKLHDIPTE